MDEIPTLDDLDEAVRGNTETIWPEVVEWNQRVAKAWSPTPGSALAIDDQQVPTLFVSVLAQTSLATASQHLMSVIRYLHVLGPTTMSLYSMLRTAIWGGAQAVWLLEHDDRDERLKRAARIEFYSRDNYRMWLNTYTDDSSTGPDSLSLEDAKTEAAKRIALLGDKPPKVDQTRIVCDVAKIVHADGPNPASLSEGTWRSLGAIAHALPWELDTRIGAEVITGAGVTTRKFTASWAELSGALCDAHEFTKHGWKLLDRRSRPSAQ